MDDHLNQKIVGVENFFNFPAHRPDSFEACPPSMHLIDSKWRSAEAVTLASVPPKQNGPFELLTID